MPKKALVVDNDFFFVEFLAESLEQRGYEVIKAYDGKEGIAKLEDGAVDILFVDLIMPKISGEKFIEFARMKFPDVHFPIIVVSGIVVERLDQISEIGADYFIAKGPMERMADQLNELFNQVEKQPSAAPAAKDILVAKNLRPRKTTLELTEAVSFQQAITECIGLGIIVVDKDAGIIIANSMALDIINKSTEEVLNQPIVTIFPDQERPKLIGALKEILRNPELRNTAFSVTLRSQTIRVIVSLLKVDGEIGGWIIAMEDTGQWVEQA